MSFALKTGKFCVSSAVSRWSIHDVEFRKKRLAAVYGNLESMFWLPDDRIPELLDTNDWDQKIWGRWEDTSYQMVWKAVEAWLPVFNCRRMEQDETLTRMFSGTPFGPVDVVSPYSDLSAYRIISFFRLEHYG